MINKFRGDYYFLSNFFEAPVTFNGISYRNNEAAFQSAKVLDKSIQKKFSTLDASSAKKMGRYVHLRPDWEAIKFDTMYDICFAKFFQNKELGAKLIATGDEFLEEGNAWGDRVWGTVNGEGENHLGKILMKVRNDLKFVIYNAESTSEEEK